MSICSEILKGGIFDSIIIHTNKSFSENYTEWLKASSYQEIKRQQNAGISIGIPIDGVPIEWKLDFSQQDYNQLKNDVESGKIRNLSTEEEIEIVQRSASKAIVNAWTDCIKHTQFGLLDYEDIGEEGAFSVLFRYSPNTEGDLPPIVNSFHITGCKCINPPQIGAKIPYGGMTILFTRDRNQQDYFPEATYVLNTTKGTADGKIPASDPPHKTPKIRGIKFFHATNPNKSSWPSCEIEVPEGYKLIGGGGRLNCDTVGNFLTSSYPLGPYKWLITGKDHGDNAYEPVTCDVWAIAIYDQNDEFDIVIDWADSDKRNYPQRDLSVRNGLQLVGGGARANWNQWGQLLTASYPIGRDTWSAMSKAHFADELSTITTFAIGICPRNGAKNIEIRVNEVTTDLGIYPAGRCPAPDGCRLIGGGVRANWVTNGIMLTASYPEGNEWVANTRSHGIAENGTATIYAIGIPNEYFA